MRRPLACLAVLVVALPLVAGPAAAQGPAPSATRAWVAEPQAGETTAVVSLALENPGMYELYIVSASSPVAGKAELRQAGPGGVPLPVKELLVAAYGRIELTPAGIHVALSDLKRPLKAGETIDVALVTDSGEKIAARADVRAR
jgi:copper(I)-binding protein